MVICTNPAAGAVQNINSCVIFGFTLELRNFFTPTEVRLLEFIPIKTLHCHIWRTKVDDSLARTVSQWHQSDYFDNNLSLFIIHLPSRWTDWQNYILQWAPRRSVNYLRNNLDPGTDIWDPDSGNPDAGHSQVAVKPRLSIPIKCKGNYVWPAKLSELMFQNMKLTRGFILKPFAGRNHDRPAWLWLLNGLPGLLVLWWNAII